MLTFLIVALILGVVLFLDFRPVLKAGERAVTVFYSVLTVLSLLILALHSFGFTLPSIVN